MSNGIYKADFFNKIKDLLEWGFLTGGYGFKIFDSSSDIDIAFPIYNKSEILRLCDGFTQTPSEYFGGFYIVVDGEFINLIPLHPHAVMPWYLTTKAMRGIIHDISNKDKQFRHMIFESMVSLFKGVCNYQGTPQAYMQYNSICKNDEQEFMEFTMSMIEKWNPEPITGEDDLPF